MHQVIRNGKRCIFGLVLCEGPLAVEVDIACNLLYRSNRSSRTFFIGAPARKGPCACFFALGLDISCKRLSDSIRFIFDNGVRSRDTQRRIIRLFTVHMVRHRKLLLFGHAGPLTDEGHVLIAHRVSAASLILGASHIPAGEGVLDAINRLGVLSQCGKGYRLAFVIFFVGILRRKEILHSFGQSIVAIEGIRNAVRLFNLDVYGSKTSYRVIHARTSFNLGGCIICNSAPFFIAR